MTTDRVPTPRPVHLAATFLMLNAIGAAAPAWSQDGTSRARTEPIVAPPAGHGHEWGYVGPTGPGHWADLSQQYEVCSTGTQESPVDLRDPVPAALGALELRYPEMPLRIVNNGHTIQVEAAPGGTLRLGGKDYELVQVHFHHPSEHLLAGRRFPMEAHLVHRGLDGGLAVVGVLIEEGARSEALVPVLDSAPPKEAAARTIAGATFQPGSLVPPEHGFLRYNGSLTTPPCTENVEWAVMAQPAQASRQQIEAFARLYPMNARPLQALNRRFLLQSHDVGEKTGGR